MHTHQGAARRLLSACGGDTEAAQHAADLAELVRPGSGTHALLHEIGHALAGSLGPDEAQQHDSTALAVSMLRDLADFAERSADELEAKTYASQVGEATTTYQLLGEALSPGAKITLMQDSGRFSREILGNLWQTVIDSVPPVDEHTSTRERAN